MAGIRFWEQHIKKNTVLSPIDRIAEVLFGLIMVLTFTGAISGTTETRPEIRDLLWAAIKCNIAWGIVDAIMYSMNVMIERGHAKKILIQLKELKNKDEARELVKDEIQPIIASLLNEAELNRLAENLRNLETPGNKIMFTFSDLGPAFRIFLLVFLCTLPVALPFAIFTDIELALSVSNWVALGLLFIGGYILAKYAGFRPFLTALAYTLIGVLLVFLTMHLGG